MIHAFSGGVGGAKLARGLADVVPPQDLTLVVNTGDDFDYLGLRIMPDFDSVVYAVSGLNDEERGWGRSGETWRCKETLGKLGVDTWFSLGDKDLALHLLRRSLLDGGATVTDAATEIAQGLGITCRVVPMTNHPVRTMVVTDEGELSFQDYFVRRRCEPRVRAFRFAGANRGTPSPAWFQSLASGASSGLVLCPSNPFVSIDPILSLPAVRGLLMRREFPVVAVSPLVGGAAVKGPLAKMLRELGLDCDPLAIAAHYADFLDGIVIDQRDAAYEAELRRRGLRIAVCDTMMADRDVSRRLARVSLDLLTECGARRAA
ncbi:2-phospho-L-lactate transferase [Ramlibacter tataouinensis]|uniref:2-phospho-L-lactate transferase n=1 Tax=Ramlibacter tataouinensis TaxID=94132 RepID=UPI0022F39480|nr:2-phospho-L-lactate transferase [Ramlibacter tataouinensis]WBY00537.1 2-phospho-L-lactate transferase [Ramlibacter tataouinensis]